MTHSLLAKQLHRRLRLSPEPRATGQWCRPVLALALLLASLSSHAQAVATYAFAQTAGVYTAVAGGTALGSTSTDDASFTALPIGFTFSYAGVPYTTFSVNANGFLVLGNNATSSYLALSDGSNNNVVAALNQDLQAQAGASLTYQTIGSGPGRTLVVQWTNYRKYNTMGDSFSFQIRLSETTNAVTLAYDAFTVNATDATVQTGLLGATATDYNARTTTTNWSATTPGGTSAATMPLSAAVKPAAGQTYTFTPPVVTCPAANTLSASNQTSTSATLNWLSSAPATGTGTFTVEYGAAGFTPGTGTAVAGLAGPSYNATGLAPATPYEFYVTQNCTLGNGNSTRTGPRAFTTLAAPPAFAVARSTGAAYTSIASTGTSVPFSGTNTDDNTSDIVSLSGFNFTYMGAAVTGFRVCTNGWMTFNTAQTNTDYRNNLGGAGLTQVLAPFWEDLVCQGNPGTAAALAASMKYRLTGTAGSQVLTVEWIGMETYSNSGPSLNFQVRLVEGSNTIQYVYGNMSGFDGSADYTYSYSLGLTGPSNVNLSNYLAQQAANTSYFAAANANTTNIDANGLSIVPSCFSQVQFVPAAAFSSGAAPVASAPTNNEPASALALAVGSSAPTDFCAVFTSANATATPGITACTATTPGIPDDDVWFSFALAGASNTTLSLRSSGGYDGVLQLFSGAPGNLTPVACQNATGSGLTETYANSSLAAGTYYVRVYEAGTGAGTNGTFVLSVFATPPIPTNDECAGALPLTAAPTCTPSTGTTLGATASAGVTACVGAPDDDVWYRFTATASAQTVTVQGASGFDAVVQAFSGSCGSLTSLSCANSSSTGGLETVALTGLALNSVYYVRVYHAGSSTGTGNFTVCLTATCDAPTGLAATNLTTTSANLTWTAGTGGATFAVEYGPAGFTPGTGTVIPAATSPQAITGLTAGTAYQFYVVQTCSAGVTAAAGPASFTTRLANDQCSGAIAIACGQTLTGTTIGATTDGDPTGSCNTSITGQGGVFYAYTGTGDVVTASTCSGPTATGGDTKLFVFSGTCAVLTCVDGNDDTPTCTNGVASSVTFPSTVGTQYYLFVQGFSSDLNFGLSLTCAPPLTNLVVSTPQNVSGTYNNVTVQNGGVATLTGPLTVNGTLTVQGGGVLAQNCQPLTGPGSFELQAGAELQICDPAGVAATGATGAVQLAGTRTYASDASYTYNGTVAQLTGAGLPGQVRNLTVNNSLGLSLSQAVSVAQVARLQSGNLATGGQPFVLLSSAAGTALVDNSGGVVAGTGTMQRAVTSTVAGPAYRHFSSPVQSTTLSDLSTAGFTPTFNPGYNNSAAPGLVTPFPTVFGYDQARLATTTSTYGAFDKGWFSPAAGTDAMQPTRGYTANAPATAAPIDFVGTFNNAAQNSGALSRGTDAQAGWQLLGNPYPSPLDWSTVAAAQRPGLDGAMYVYQSTGQYAGTYRSYENGVGASPLINAGSGYFVRVSAPGTPGAVNLTNANRVTTFGPQPAFGRGATDTRPQLQLQLTGAGLTDETFVYFEAGATAGIDARYDATKLANPAGLDLAALSGTQALAIDGLAPLAGTDVVVPLMLRVPQAGSFGFEVADLVNFGAAVVYLRDALAGTQQQLAPGTRYAFALATATAGNGRFSLVFRPATVTATRAELNSATVSLYPNPAHGSFTVLLPPLAGPPAVRATLVNALGQVVQARTIGLNAAGATAEFNTQALATGVYTLQLQTENQLLTKRVVVE